MVDTVPEFVHSMNQYDDDPIHCLIIASFDYFNILKGFFKATSVLQ